MYSMVYFYFVWKYFGKSNILLLHGERCLYNSGILKDEAKQIKISWKQGPYVKGLISIFINVFKLRFATVLNANIKGINGINKNVTLLRTVRSTLSTDYIATHDALMVLIKKRKKDERTDITCRWKGVDWLNPKFFPPSVHS